MVQNYSKGDEPVPASGYRLVEFLGRGGFGEVWKATAPGGAEAAIKIVSLDGTKGQKEFRALNRVKRIRHSHLVPIIAYWLKAADGSILDDVFTTRSSFLQTQLSADPLQETTDISPADSSPQAAELILAMGLGDKSLSDRLKECRREGLAGISREELLHHMEDAAEGIDFLNSPEHDLGSGPVAIQHCDIKPDNLMIVGGATQICDFGLARMMGTDRSTSAAATIAYAAPECLETGEPSESTDQYCLAISYFELLTGRLPYDDKTPAAAMKTILAGKLDFSRLPAAEQEVLRRATSRDPAGRYPSALAMVKALREAAAADVPSTTEFTSPVAERRRRRRTLVVRILALLIVVALGAFGVWWAPHWKARRALAAFNRAEGQVAKGQFKEALLDYTRAIELEQTMGTAYAARARCRLVLKEYNPAISDLNEALKYGVEDAVVFSRLAAAWFGNGEWQKAIDYYTRAIEQDPHADGVDVDYVGRANTHLVLRDLELENENGDLTHAQECLQRALEDSARATMENPSNGQAQVLLADCRLQQEETDVEGAVAAFNEALKLREQGHPVPADALFLGLDLLASTYAKKKQYAEAAKWARKAAELAPDEQAEKELLGFAGECDSLVPDGV